MADDSFRSNSSRKSGARGEAAHDPLAELARLIGQGDPYAERKARRSADDVAPGFDWAANEGYADEGGHAEEHHPPPLPPAPYSTYAGDEQDYAPEPSADGRYFSGSAGKFNGFGADAGAYEPDHQAPVSRQLPAFMSAAPVGSYAAEEPERAQEAGEDYGDYADDYYDEPPSPRRRGGLVVMMAVLGLVIVGTAGAFAYRNMFGSAVFAGLPPIIKASIAPNKILPNNGDAQADNSTQSGTSAQANSDKLVSREEQPVNMEPPKISSRVVATIPIGAGQTPLPSVAAAPAPAAPEASAPPYSTASTSTASVPQPDGSQSAPSPIPTTAAGPPAAPSEPKKVRTVLIHADQSGATAAQPAVPALAPAPRSARSAAAKAGASAAAAPVGANAPLSIVPGADGEAAPPAATAPAPVASAPSRSRAAAAAPAPVTMVSAEPSAAVPASAPSGGGYAVQVTSQHSEADAKASFKELRAKFPNQLSGREPIIRRADLGTKGVFYRAMVGPFASMEEAAGVCSSLKAAGGNCLVQRN
jgi:SPOR domain